jgi:hypothetical protein
MEKNKSERERKKASNLKCRRCDEAHCWSWVKGKEKRMKTILSERRKISNLREIEEKRKRERVNKEKR